MNEEVLEKTLAIENASREILKEKRKHEETEKTMNKRIETLIADYDQRLAQQEDLFLKAEKILKE